MVPRVVIVVLACVLAAGCSGSDGSPERAPHAGDEIAGALGDPATGSATVDDATADVSNADLKGVTLTLDPANLVVRYELANGLPGTGTVLLVVTVFSDDDSVVRQLGAQWINQQSPLVYMYDFDGTEEHLDGMTPTVQGSTVTVTFPASTVAGLGASFWWSAVTNVDGNDVDHAPDADTISFPS